MSTSKLQSAVGEALSRMLPTYKIVENCRPDWLLSHNDTRLELDFYIEELKLAFEIQGEQHYAYTPHFHKDRTEFEKRKIYDMEKRGLCYRAGVELVEIRTVADAIAKIHEVIKEPSADIITPNLAEEELSKWRKKAIKNLERGKTDFHFGCKYIPFQIERQIKLKLPNCKNELDILKMFSEITI